MSQKHSRNKNTFAKRGVQRQDSNQIWNNWQANRVANGQPKTCNLITNVKETAPPPGPDRRSTSISSTKSAQIALSEFVSLKN